MTDYIADGKGYRIVKTRNEYVGSNSVEATETKKVYVPIKHSTKVVTKVPNQFQRETSTTTTTTTEEPSNTYDSSTEAAAASNLPLVQEHPLPLLPPPAKPLQSSFRTRRPSEKTLFPARFSPGSPRNGTFVATYIPRSRRPSSIRIRGHISYTLYHLRSTFPIFLLHI